MGGESYGLPNFFRRSRVSERSVLRQIYAQKYRAECLVPKRPSVLLQFFDFLPPSSLSLSLSFVLFHRPLPCPLPLTFSHSSLYIHLYIFLTLLFRDPDFRRAVDWGALISKGMDKFQSNVFFTCLNMSKRELGIPISDICAKIDVEAFKKWAVTCPYEKESRTHSIFWSTTRFLNRKTLSLSVNNERSRISRDAKIRIRIFGEHVNPIRS